VIVNNILPFKGAERFWTEHFVGRATDAYNAIGAGGNWLLVCVVDFTRAVKHFTGAADPDIVRDEEFLRRVRQFT
jgi:hypothetical protein